MAAETMGCIFDEVFLRSTGIIGVPLPAEKIVAAMPSLRASLGNTPGHAEMFANAIMTTDTKRKVARAVFTVDGVAVNLFGAAKGAGMIHPQLAPAGSQRWRCTRLLCTRRCWCICLRISRRRRPSCSRC